MYERERVENERLRTQLKDYQHVLDIEVKENQRRHDKIWDLEDTAAAEANLQSGTIAPSHLQKGTGSGYVTAASPLCSFKTRFL
jgi:hypothetical protein